MKHLDLFSGIGGFALAAKWAGIETVAFSEIDPFCCKVLEKNFPEIPNLGDIHNIKERLDVDLITGGFPCQPFSQAGKKRGKEDDRYLWPEFFKVIQQQQPKAALIENVANAAKMVLEIILFDLESAGYQTCVFIIPACAANAPHRRDRLWIIAHRDGLGAIGRLDPFRLGYIQENWKRHVAEIQQKWAQFLPDTWQTYTARDWLDYNTRASRGNDGVSKRLDKDRIKALGNAVVPQVVYPLLECIKRCL